MNIEFEQKYYVIKVADVARYLNDEGKKALYRCMDSLLDSRRHDGKRKNNYLVINTEESYAGQVAQIMQRHGHFTPGEIIGVEAPDKQECPLNQLRDEIHQNAVDHGWWEEERSFGDIIALCHSELSEALEEFRDGNPMVYYNCNGTNTDDVLCNVEEDCVCIGSGCKHHNDKPEGIAIELADCMIRILDYCGKAGIDIEEAIRIKHEYNKTRPYRHGGKVI